MKLIVRRLATVLLLLAVPLRVYAAVVMAFCGQPGELPRQVPMEAASMHAQMHDHHDGIGKTNGVEPQHGDDAGPQHAQAHSSCAACCCTGMIATAHYDWQAQSFVTPATPDFVAIAIPPTVPHRLERPPRDLPA